MTEEEQIIAAAFIGALVGMIIAPIITHLLIG